MTEWQRRMFAAGSRTARKRALRAARKREQAQIAQPIDWLRVIDAALAGASWGAVVGAVALLVALAVLGWTPW